MLFASAIALASVLHIAEASTVSDSIFSGVACRRQDQGIRLQYINQYSTGAFDESAAEAADYDAASKQLIFTNANLESVSALDISSLSEGSDLPEAVELPTPAGYNPSSVSVSKGLVAVALQKGRDFEVDGVAYSESLPGAVGFYKKIDGDWEQVGFVDFDEEHTQRKLLKGTGLPLGYAGSGPDMLSFTPDGKKVVVAIEGEPAFNEDEEKVAFDLRNPEGSVVIIDVKRAPHVGALQSRIRSIKHRIHKQGGKHVPRHLQRWLRKLKHRLAHARHAVKLHVSNVSFIGAGLSRAFDCAICSGSGTNFVPELYADGRKYGGGIDAEPEYVAISDDSKTAYVTLQENNAVAIVSLEGNGKLESVVGLGRKDHSTVPLDLGDNGEIEIEKYDGFEGLYQPDTIAYQSIGGKGYLFTANEGDARDGENTEASEVTPSDSLFASLGNETAARFADADDLGGIEIFATQGQAPGADTYDTFVGYGGRSFSILDSSGNQVFDSGAAFEEKIAKLIRQGKLPEAAFNADNTGAELDERSDRKGPEPEAITTGVVNGKTYAFVGLERNSGIVVYDVSSPAHAKLVQYVAHRHFLEDGEDDAMKGADLGPEYVVFVPAEDSPIVGTPLLISTNEVSGTLGFWKINVCS